MKTNNNDNMQELFRPLIDLYTIYKKDREQLISEVANSNYGTEIKRQADLMNRSQYIFKTLFTYYERSFERTCLCYYFENKVELCGALYHEIYIVRSRDTGEILDFDMIV